VDTGESYDEPTVTTDSIRGGPAVMIGFGQFVFSLSSEDISVDELKKIAGSITPAADPDDMTTWFDADKAIPLH